MNMKYRELYHLFCEQERNRPKEHLTAYITFAPESFAPDSNYTQRERTYVVSSDNKAFRPHTGGFSIFASCLDENSDPCIRLDQYMADIHGGKNGWIVEDCCLVGWVLLSSNERELRQPKVFYQREPAVEAMLRELCDTNGCIDYEDARSLFDEHEGNIVDCGYGTTPCSAWLNDSASGNWDWLIRTVRIYTPLNIVVDDIHEEGQDNP